MELDLTDAQKRVPIFLDDHRRWYNVCALNQTKLLESGDVVALPALIDMGLLMYEHLLDAVFITKDGATVRARLCP